MFVARSQIWIGLCGPLGALQALGRMCLGWMFSSCLSRWLLLGLLIMHIWAVASSQVFTVICCPSPSWEPLSSLAIWEGRMRHSITKHWVSQLNLQDSCCSKVLFCCTGNKSLLAAVDVGLEEGRALSWNQKPVKHTVCKKLLPFLTVICPAAVAHHVRMFIWKFSTARLFFLILFLSIEMRVCPSTVVLPNAAVLSALISWGICYWSMRVRGKVGIRHGGHGSSTQMESEQNQRFSEQMVRGKVHINWKTFQFYSLFKKHIASAIKIQMNNM